jgi:hypothetical protein
MMTEQVDQALSDTLRAHSWLEIDHCGLARLVYDFLQGVKQAPGCPWYVKVAIRQLHGAISALRRQWDC